MFVCVIKHVWMCACVRTRVYMRVFACWNTFWMMSHMCCSVLQCVAVCCSVLQCVAVCCSVLQCVCMLKCLCARTRLCLYTRSCVTVCLCIGMGWLRLVTNSISNQLASWSFSSIWMRPVTRHGPIDWFWLLIFRTNLVRGPWNKEMTFQNKGAVLVQIAPLFI